MIMLFMGAGIIFFLFLLIVAKNVKISSQKETPENEINNYPKK
jgi:hypothetical protein